VNDVRVDEDLDRWAEIIVGRAQRPIDAWAVAALLESEGLRDVDARDRFGKSDVFELAKVVHQRALAISPTKRTAEVAPAAGAARRIAANLLTGGLYALPLVGQIACIFTTRYSLWASLDYSPREATIVGVGTLASFIASGGLVTAIGREGSVHRSQRAFAMLRYGLTNLVALGLLFEILGIAALFAFWLFAPVMDLPLFIPAVGYFAALSLLWTSMAALYALGSHVVSLASVMPDAEIERRDDGLSSGIIVIPLDDLDDNTGPINI